MLSPGRFLLASVVFWILGPVLAARPAVGLQPFLGEQIDAIVSVEMSRQKIPGVSIAIAFGSEVPFARGYGMADLENSVPVTPDTVFRTASLAKPMTAAGVLLLWEKGRLDLDVSIRAYCPEFPEKKWKTTGRQLLGHLGGIRHYGNSFEELETRHFLTLQDSLRVFREEPLVHQPGTTFLYTTYGYNLLGCAIEGVSGQTFEEFMNEKIFVPLSMLQTRTDDHYALVSRRARGYLRVEPGDFEKLPEELRKRLRVGDILNAPLHDTSVKVPGGGLLSCPLDLVRFTTAVLEGELLEEETVRQMWVSQATPDGRPTGYGLGWQVMEEGGEKIVSHSGRQPGVRTRLAVLPGRKLAVAVMCNLQNASLDSMVRDLLRLLTRSSTEID